MGSKTKRRSKRERLDVGGTLDDHADRLDELGAGVTADAAGEGSAERAAGDAGAGTGGGSAGLVDVDRDAIAAEAAAIAATAPTDAGAPPAPTAPELEPAIAPPVDVLASADEIKPPIRGLCSTVARTFAPNWEISAKESDDVADALSLVLVYWMPPGALDPKYVAAFSLATSIYGLASTRREPDGSFKPLRVKPSVTTPASSPTPPTPFPTLRPV